MANEILTDNPLITSASGEEITDLDQQILNDYADLMPSDFINLYGQDTFNSLNQQQNQLKGAAQDVVIANNRSPDEFVADSLKNVVAGAATGIVDTGAFVFGLLGADSVAQSLAKASKGINEISQSIGSEAEQAQQRDYQLRQQGLENRAQREYKENIQQGMSEVEALSRREASNFLGTFKNALASGNVSNIIASGFGSLGSDIILTGGVTALAKSGAKVASKAIPSIVERTKSALDSSNEIVNKIKAASPWMLSTGLQEGGSQYVQLLNEGENTPLEKLLLIPEFNTLVADYVKAGKSQKEAQEAAKQDLINDAALQAGIRTGLTAAALNYATRGLAKPFERSGKTYQQYIGEALTEPLEETLTEGSGTIYSNLATREFLDPTQEIAEGLGQGSAEGFIGGLGIVGARAVPHAVVKAGTTAGKYAANKISEARKNRIISSDAEKETIYNRIGNVERVLPTITSNLEGTVGDSINNAAGRLKNIADAVFEEQTDESTGETTRKLDPEKAISLMNQIDADSSTVEAAVFSKSKIKGNNFKKHVSKIYSGLKTNIANHISDIISEQRSHYNLNTSLDPQQLNNEAAYILSQNAQNSEDGLQAFQTLPENIQNQIKNTVLSSPLLQKKMTDFLAKNELIDQTSQQEAQTQLNNQEEAHSTVVPTPEPTHTETTVSVATPEELDRFYANAPTLEAVSEAETTNLPALKQTIPLPAFNAELEVRVNDADDLSLYYKKDNKHYLLSEEDTDKIIQAFNSKDSTALSYKFQNIDLSLKDNSLKDSGQHFAIKSNGKIQLISLKNNKAYVINSNNNYLNLALPQEVLDVLNSSEATIEEKAQVIKEFYDSTSDSRASYSLDEEALYKENKYIEDNEIKDFSSNEIREEFEDIFGEKLSKIFRPVRRTFFLWKNAHPLQSLRDLLKDRTSIEQYLRVDNATNARSLLNNLFYKNGSMDYDVKPNGSPRVNESLINKIRYYLNPEGPFITRFKQLAQQNLVLDDSTPDVLKETFFDQNGKPNERLLEIASIAALQWLPMLHAYKHSLNTEELARRNLVLRDQDSDFDTSSGVISSMATQNLATILRKMMGVAKTLDASQNDVDDFLGYLAVKIADSMIEGNFVETTELTAKQRNTNGSFKDINLLLLAPTENFRRIFGKNSSILLSLLDPTLKNSWHETPQPVKPFINNTNVPVNKALSQTVEIQNKKEKSLNTRFISFLTAIGSARGITELLEGVADASNQFKYTAIDFVSRKGRALTRSLAEDKYKEILIGFHGTPVKDIHFYDSYVPIVNSRTMQEGAVTYQNNKLARQIEVTKNSYENNLTDPEVLNSWKNILGQKFGEKTSREDFALYKGKIDKTINFMVNAAKNPEYKKLFETLLNQKEEDFAKDTSELDQDKIRDNLKKLTEFSKEFTKATGYKLNNEEAYNALVELMAYSLASEEERKHFDSNIFLEIDGISDGAANNNTSFGLAISGPTPTVITNSAKTGTAYGIDASSQELLSIDPKTGKGNKAGELFGTSGADIHNEVAHVKCREYILKRLDSLNQDIEAGGTRAMQAKLAKKALKSTLTLFKAIGWVTGDIDNPNNSNDPMQFDREVSKHLVTIIPYGSEERGSTGHIAEGAVSELYRALSNKFAAIAGSSASPNQTILEDFKDSMVGTTYVIDTETTGTDPDSDSIIQIAVRKLVDGKDTGETKEFWLKNTGSKQIPAKINGKDNPVLAEYQKREKEGTLLDPKNAFDNLFKYLGSKPLLGHNLVGFDAQILEKQSGRKISNKLIDTLSVARIYNQYASNSLDALRETEIISNANAEKAHLADKDVTDTINLAKELYKTVDDKIAQVKEANQASTETAANDFNGVTWKEIQQSLTTLFSINRSREDILSENVDYKQEDYVKNLFSELPTQERLTSTNWAPNRSGKFYNRTLKSLEDPRNIEVTSKGLQQMTDAMLVVFGQPVQAAVKEVIGVEGMRGAKIPTVLGGLLQVLAQGVERLYNGNNNNLRAMTGKQFLKAQKAIQKVSPIFTLPSGAKSVARRVRYVDEENPRFKSSKTGISYHSSRTYLDSIGVSAGPLTVQALGDASMILELENLAKDLIAFAQVFDGVYVDVSGIQKLGELANKATFEAQKQKVIHSLLKRIEQVGKSLKDQGFTQQKDPYKAIAECIANLASGENIDGTVVSGSNSNAKEIQNTILRYIDSFNNKDRFNPSLFEQTQKKIQKEREKAFEDKKFAKDVIQNEVLNFFDEIKVIEFNEKISHEVMEDIPQSIHHMSGSNSYFKYGKPLSPSKAEELRKAVNSFYGSGNKFATWQDLLSAYLFTKMHQLVENKYANDPKYKNIVSQWKILSPSARANDGIEKSLMSEAVEVIDNAFGKVSNKTPSTKDEFYISESLGKDIIQKVFSALPSNKRSSVLFHSLYGKVLNLLPENIEIRIIGSLEALPINLRAQVKRGQTGIFTIQDGVPKIYVVDANRKGKFFVNGKPVRENIVTLVHECIHAAVSGPIAQYYVDPSVLPKDTQSAIKNLEDLLSDFMEKTDWGRDSSPQLIRLQRILQKTKDPAEKLDESLAYILSNIDTLNALANYKTSRPEYHSKNLGKLIKSVITAAKKAWKKLLNIVTGSSMDKELNESTVDLLEARAFDFIKLYGINTLVLLNEQEKLKPRDRSKQLKRLNGTSRAMVRDALLSHPLIKDFSSALYEKIKQNSYFNFNAVNRKAFTKNVNKNAWAKEYQKQIRQVMEYEDSLYRFIKDYINIPDDFAKTAIGLMRKDLIPDQGFYKMAQVYNALVNNLDRYFMINNPSIVTQEELDASSEIYDLITGKSKFFTRNNLPRNDLLNPQIEKQAILFALALTNPDVNAALGKIKIADVEKSKKSIFSPLESIEDFANETLDRWTKESVQDQTAESVIKAIMEDALEYLQPASERTSTIFNDIFFSMDRAFFNSIAGLVSLGSKELGQSIRDFGNARDVSAPFAHNILSDLVRSSINRIRKPSLVNVLKDVYARIPSNYALAEHLKKIKGYADRVRNLFLHDTPHLAMEKFKNTLIDQNMKRFLYRALARTNISSLTDKEAQDVLTNKTKCETLIKQLEAQLDELAPEYANKYKQKSLQLANWATNYARAGKNLLMNAHSIAHLFGETEYLKVPATQEVVDVIRRLITVYSVRNLESSEVNRLKEIFNKDSDGILSMIRYIRDSHVSEENKIKALGITDIYNYFEGYMPKGNTPSAQIVYIPKSKEKEFIKRGYKTLGVYKASNIDVKEPILRMIINIPHEVEYQETVLQGITTTAYGYAVGLRSNKEISGVRINNLEELKILVKNYALENNSQDINHLVPIYDEEGYITGFDRSVDPEDRRELDKNNDIFVGSAQFVARLDRQRVAESMNRDAIDIIYDEFMSASEHAKQTEFVDVMHSDDPLIKIALARLSAETKRYIRQKFGDHLYVRTDEIDALLGHQRMSVDDLWNNNFMFPKAVENGIVQCLEAIFGPRIRYYLNNTEKGLMSFASWARDTIIVRSGFVSILNIVANTLMLNFAYGMPFTEIAKSYRDGFIQTQKYNKLIREKNALEYQKASSDSQTKIAAIDKRLDEINITIKNLPIYQLIKEGEYSTISAEGNIIEEAEIFKHKLDDVISSYANKFAKGPQAKTIASNILMTKGSTTYKTMAELVNLGDWLAKVAGYKYLTSASKKYRKPMMLHEQAVAMVSTLFVDYDQPIGPHREWLNRTGLTWFMTYKWRMIPAAIMTMLLNPARVLFASLLADLPGFQGTPLNENIFSKFVTGDISFSVGLGMMFRSLFLHPLALFLSLAK